MENTLAIARKERDESRNELIIKEQILKQQ